MHFVLYNYVPAKNLQKCTSQDWYKMKSCRDMQREKLKTHTHPQFFLFFSRQQESAPRLDGAALLSQWVYAVCAGRCYSPPGKCVMRRVSKSRKRLDPGSVGSGGVGPRCRVGGSSPALVRLRRGVWRQRGNLRWCGGHQPQTPSTGTRHWKMRHPCCPMR